MGFTNEDDDAMLAENDDIGENMIYEPHLSFEEMMIGIKEGRYFQGRFNVSRLV